MKTRATERVAHASRHALNGKAVPLLMSCVLLACKPSTERHDHAKEHPAGHDHHQEDHGHGDTPVVRFTAWSPELELFAEVPPLVSGTPALLLANVTVLANFSPAAGPASLKLTGPEQVEVRVAGPVQAGVFRLEFTPPKAGVYHGQLTLEGPPTLTVNDFELHVSDTAEQAQATASLIEHEGVIELLKEQQWGVPFATQFAEEHSLVASIEVAGSVTTPPGGSAEVGAPIAGRLLAPNKGLPRPGESVKKGQLLASLAPVPASPEHAARATLAVVEAEARAAAATVALERARRLIVDEAISQRELEEAEREATVAQESVKAARRAAALFSGASGGAPGGSWDVRAPISGVLAQVSATPGASVATGDPLFYVVDVSELWLRARVPEQDAAQLRTDRDAHYQAAGLTTWTPLTIGGPAPSAEIVTVGQTVDAKTRTVDLIYALRAPDPALRVGGLVQLSLPVGEDFTGVAVPRTALVSDEGRSVVYVQVDGEHFVERLIRPGPSAGPFVGVLSGLQKGERVVTRGANLVRLADRSGTSQPHGHIH